MVGYTGTFARVQSLAYLNPSPTANLIRSSKLGSILRLGHPLAY